MATLSETDAFITPDGLIWQCHHGEHGFVVEQIIAELGEDAVRGSLLLLGNGTWVQEGQTGVITVAQSEAVNLLAGFPECGMTTAALDILTTFAPQISLQVIRRAIASADGQRTIDQQARIIAQQFGLDGDNTQQVNALLS